MNNHTPGPWRFIADDQNEDQPVPYDYVGPGYFGNPQIVGANGEKVVGCSEYYVFSGADDVELICAAPAMASALRQFFNYFGSPPDDCECIPCSIWREHPELVKLLEVA